MKITALDISLELLNRMSIEDYERTSKSIDNLKLQKLLFYAQKIHINYTGEPLFDDNIEAWQYGPVIPDAYHKYKHYKYRDIDLFKELHGWTSTLNYNLEILIDFIIDRYSIYTANYLVNLTHTDRAWKSIYIPSIRNKVIPIELLKEDNYINDYEFYLKTIDNFWKIN